MKQFDKLSRSELISKINSLHDEVESLKLQIIQSEKNKQSSSELDSGADLQNREKFRILYESAPFSYQSLDEDGVLLEVNTTWLKTLGYKRGEVIGIHFVDLLHPRHKKRFEKNFPEYKKQGSIHNIQFAIKHKNGQYRDISFEGCIGFDKSGKFKQSYCIFQDITERKKTEKALLESGILNTAIVNNTEEGIIVCDTQLRYQQWNPYMEKLTHKMAFNVIGTHPRDVFPSHIAKQIMVSLERTLKGKQTDPIVFQISPSDSKSQFWVSNQNSPLKNAEGEITGVIGIIRNISEQRAAEEALALSEERFRAVFEQSPIAIEIFDAKGKLLEINKKTLELFGVDNKKYVLGFDLWSDPNLSDEKIKRLQKGETTFISADFNFDLVKEHNLYPTSRSGIMHMDMYANPLKKGKNISGYLIQIIEVTEKKKSELELKESEERFSTTFKHSPLPASLTRISDTVYTQVNHAWCRFFGYSEDQVLGKKAKSLNIVTEEISKRFEEEFRREGRIRDFETSVQVKNGDTKHILSSIEMIMIGGDAYMLNMSVDISEKKRMFEQLEQRNEYIETIMDNMPIGFAINSIHDGQLKYMNARFEEICGWPKDIITDTNVFFDKVFPDLAYRNKMKSEFLAGMESGDSERMNWKDLKITTSQGEIRYVDAFDIPLTHQNIMISTAQDATKRKLAEDELLKHQIHLKELVLERTNELAAKTATLEKSQTALTLLLDDVNEIRNQLEHSNAELMDANKELVSFSYSVSHDLKAPLRAINGYSNIILEDYIDQLDDEGKHLLEVIIQNTNNMRQLIDDILALSRLGRKEMIKSNIDTNKLVKNLCHEILNEHKDRVIRFDISDLPIINGDSGMLKQLFRNLISNAVKFTSLVPEANISIGTELIENQTVIFIEDNGIGFDMKYVNKIFQVFQRLHTVDQFEGTGIGLALVKRIVNKHKGRIWAESKLNIGTKISLTLQPIIN